MSYQVSDSRAALGERLAALVPNGGHRTLAERAFATLHDAILRGDLIPGERLPIEDLATAMGMSPMPIREALRQLDAVGLVENVPHRGATVTDLSVQDLKEVYDARLALELVAIQAAARDFTDEDAREGRRWLDQLAQAVRSDAAADALHAHTRFHFALYRAAGSRWLGRLIAPLWESAERYRVATVGANRDYLRSRMREHERLLAACVQHQPQVAEAELWNHLAVTANAVSREMDGGELYKLRRVPAARKRSA